MKRFCLLKFVALVVLVTPQVKLGAQEFVYRTMEFAFGVRNSHGSITWDDWEASNVKIVISKSDDLSITIYSPEKQLYVIHSIGETQEDSTGCSVDCQAIDLEGLECKVRLRRQMDGILQIYVFYNDVAWVYNVVLDVQQSCVDFV